MASHGILIEIVGDEKSYLRSVESVLSSNTRLDHSFKQVGVNANLSADAQIKAALKAQEALKVNATALAARAASLPGGSREQVAATLLAAQAQDKYARSIGVTTVSTHALSGASKTAERDLSKTVRGALSGSGVFSGLGRSLAFASGGFLAVASAASLVSRSITAAEDLAKANESLDVAIRHTHGDLAVLKPQYLETAQAAAKFGVSETEALSALARATVLTGNADAAQRAYQEALVISKATGKDFNTVLVATSKGQEGMTTSLRRYGILVATTSTGQEQFNQVMQRFGGQAEANTTASDKLHASVANFEATLGTALLPTFERLATRLSDWLQKMEKSGQLQRDVNDAVRIGGDVFHTLGAAIGLVDKVTGSFANTLKALVGYKLASVLAGWAGGFKALAGAEVLAAGGAASVSAASASGVVGRVGMYTGAGALASESAVASSRVSRLTSNIGLLGAAAVIAVPYLQRAQRGLSGMIGGLFGGTAGSVYDYTTGFFTGGAVGKNPLDLLFGGNAARKARNPAAPPGLLGPVGFNPNSVGPPGLLGPAGAPPVKQWASFQLNQAEQITQANAALTRSTTDDVAAAKNVIARIKRAIDQGHLHGAALIQALQAEGSALTTIWSAEDAAAQKRAQAAQAARDRIAAAIQDSIDPLRLEVALSRDQALGKSTVQDLKRLRSAAERALRSGKLSLEQQKQAWDQITSINQQLAGQATASTEQWKQASTRALTAGLHLSRAERSELRARLSQLGPGGTVPRHGVGAYGYEIGREGRPIHVHTTVKLDGKKVASNTTKHQERRQRRNSSQRRGPNAGTAG